MTAPIAGRPANPRAASMRTPQPAHTARAPGQQAGFAALHREKLNARRERMRETRREESESAAVAEPPSHAAVEAVRHQRDESGGGGGGGGSGGDGGVRRASLPDLSGDAPELDGLLDDLACLGVDSGIFEVVMPAGQTLTVAVHARSDSVHFVLGAPPDDLGARLKRRRMELERELERRMGKRVKLAVL